MPEDLVAPVVTGFTVELIGSPEEVWQDYKRQLKSIDPDVLKATGEVVRRWSDLTPAQQRRFGPLNMRHAPRVLRSLVQSPVKIHLPERREKVTVRPRERRAASRSTASRGDPSEPDPPLVEIPPAEFRRLLAEEA